VIYIFSRSMSLSHTHIQVLTFCPLTICLFRHFSISPFDFLFLLISFFFNYFISARAFSYFFQHFLDPSPFSSLSRFLSSSFLSPSPIFLCSRLIFLCFSSIFLLKNVFLKIVAITSKTFFFEITNFIEKFLIFS